MLFKNELIGFKTCKLFSFITKTDGAQIFHMHFSLIFSLILHELFCVRIDALVSCVLFTS